MKNIRHTLIPCLAIFICLLISIWAYKNNNTSYKAEISASELKEAEKCLTHGFNPCPAGEKARQKLNYKLLSSDKLILIILALITTAISVKACKNHKTTPRPQNVCAVVIFFFTVLTITQYLSFKLNSQIWLYLQSSWIEHNIEELQRNCINGISQRDCTPVKEWLSKAKLNITAIKITCIATIAAASAATFNLSKFLLGKNNTTQHRGN